MGWFAGLRRRLIPQRRPAREDDLVRLVVTPLEQRRVLSAAALDLDANDSSGMSGADYAANFTEDSGSILIADEDATLSDADSTHLQSLTVRLTNPLDGAEEALSADTTGTSISASYDSTTWILSLSGADTVANYQEVLRSVSYENTSQNPTTTDRTITFVANDGSDDSNVATTTVTVTAQNDAPTAVDDTGAANEDGPAVSVVLTDNDTDPDSSDDLEISSIDTSGTVGAVTINPDNDSVSYDPNGQFESLAVGELATDTFTYTVSDGNGGTDTGTVTVTITGQNDAPTAVNNTGGGQRGRPGSEHRSYGQ